MPQAWTVRFPAVAGGQLWTEGDWHGPWQGSPWELMARGEPLPGARVTASFLMGPHPHI